MTFKKISSMMGLAVSTLIAAPGAWAQDSADAGWYGGANVGQSRATIDNARITSGLLGAGLATTSISDRDRSTGFKLYGGYQFNRNFALEGGYFDLGRFGFTANTAPPGTLNGNIRLNGVNLDAVGTLPLTDRLSALGRVGVNYAYAKDSFSGTGAVGVSNPNPSKRAANLKVGLGLQYALTDALSARAEIERYRVNDAVGNRGHVDLLSLGLIYRFGGKTPAPAPRAAVYEPVVAAAPEVGVDVAIVGGAKVSTKIDLLMNLVGKVDALVIGGGMANTFLAAQGFEVGKSLCEHSLADTARKIIAKAEAAHCTIILPIDATVAWHFEANTPSQHYGIDAIPADGMILDVGRQSIERIRGAIDEAKTLIWNGPLGAFEMAQFDTGTVAAARIVAERTRSGHLISVAGGGDTVAALNAAGVAGDFTYISTAGGAFLEWMEGKPLPGVDALEHHAKE